MVNIGVVNRVISKSLNDHYLNEGSINEVKNVTSDLLNVIKNSPILQLEFKVFNNIEKKHIDSDVLAPRYIDKNIQLFEVYTLEELNEEHEKLMPFINENEIDRNDEMLRLYESIQTLIEESLKISDNVDVDLIHESFNYVLEHIKKPKTNEVTEEFEGINEQVIEIAINNFNEKYGNMTSEEVELFKNLVESSTDEKEVIFEAYKNDNLKLLNSLQLETANNKISQSINKINEMKFNPEECDNDIISLFELKRGLQ